MPVELPLIEQQMDEIDAQLKGAETDLNWSSDVLEYINKTYEMIKASFKNSSDFRCISGIECGAVNDVFENL